MQAIRTPEVKPRAAEARALALAVEAGDAEAVASLLAAGVFADAPLANGATPLMPASARGFEDVARLLLSAGADASARRADGFTPLTLAAFFGHVRVARLLLEHGADAKTPTRLGTTARAWADARGFSELSSLIAAAEADTRRPAATVEQQPASHQPSPTPAHDTSEPERAAASSLPPHAARRKPVADLLIASLAPDATDARPSSERARAAEAELNARAAEVSQVFGAKSVGTGEVKPDETRDANEARRSNQGASGELTTDAGEFERSAVAGSSGELFAASQPARAGRSWQGVAGLLLLTVACAAAVYAAWRASQPVGPPTQNGVPAHSVGAQPAIPLPEAQSEAAAPQPSPDTTPLDAQGLTPTATDAPGFFVPYSTAPPQPVQPYAVYPDGASPNNPALVTEDGRAVQQPSPNARRDEDEAARSSRGARSTAVDESSRDGAPVDGDVRSNSPSQGAPPVIIVPAPRPAPPEPAATPTPGRKVIQWPPS